MDQHMEIRHLPDDICWKVAKHLDGLNEPNWKSLLSVMPAGLYDERKKAVIHMQVLNARGSPSTLLLSDLGKKGKTVKEFLMWLKHCPGDEMQKEKIANFFITDEERRRFAPVIKQGPVSKTVHFGGEVKLFCDAIGKSPMTFNWFHGERQLPSEISEYLLLSNIDFSQSGFYSCRVSNQYGCVFTQWAKVDISPPMASPMPDFSALNEPIIITHPVSQSCSIGNELNLTCDAVGNPAPLMQWFKDGIQLDGKNCRTLHIRTVTGNDEGSYVCEASNKHGRARSSAAHITLQETKRNLTLQSQVSEKVSPGNDAGIRAKNQPIPPMWRGPKSFDDFTYSNASTVLSPSAKVALLIGNQHYKSESQLGKLVHPINDTRDLAAALTSIEFLVVSLVDVDLASMNDVLKYFFDLLDAGTYGLFYFAGHGFEKDGESYMMPVDASDAYDPMESLAVSDVLLAMTSKKPRLTTILIDCCRTESPVDPMASVSLKLKEAESSEKNDPAAVQRKNVLIAYGCCPQGRVMESPSKKNGFFAAHLIEHLNKNMKVSDVIFEVAKDIDRDKIIDPATGRSQVVYVQGTLCEDLKLIDSTCSEPSGQQFELWQQAHKAPNEPVSVLKNEFIEVKFVFGAEFSNCLVIYSQVMTAANSQLCDIMFMLPDRIGGAHVEVLSAMSKKLGKTVDYVRIWNIEHLDGDITIHILVKYVVDGNIQQQRAYYTIREKPLYAKIVDQMKRTRLEQTKGHCAGSAAPYPSLPVASYGTYPSGHTYPSIHPVSLQMGMTSPYSSHYVSAASMPYVTPFQSPYSTMHPSR